MSDLTIKKLVEEVHRNALEKGWWETSRTPLEIHALLHSETAEATEAVRNREKPFYLTKNGKPEGELVELADVIIRIADWCAWNGWDLESALKAKIEYNKTRPYRHGGKAY